MKRTWFILGALGLVGLIPLGAILFLIAPAEERIFNVVLHEVYGQQQVAKERHFGGDSSDSGAAEVSDSSGEVTLVYYAIFPTSNVAKHFLEEFFLSRSGYGKPSVPIGENAALLKRSTGRHHLIFQRNNVFITVEAPKNSPLPAGSTEELAAVEKAAKILDLAIVKRQTGIQAATVSNAYCLKAEANDWRLKLHRNNLPSPSQRWLQRILP